MIELQCKRLSENATLPTKNNMCDAGWDLYASENITLRSRAATKVSTDIAIVFPETVWGQIEGRSGMSSKGVYPTGGIIDQSYTGHISVVLVNGTDVDYQIAKGDRIAQLVVRQQINSSMVETAFLPETARGSKGFGSSGK